MTAYKFQEKYTGVQIYVWHAESEDRARKEFNSLVFNPKNWIFLCSVDI